MHVESSVVLGAPEGGVLQISIDGDDRRIFWRFDSRIFLVKIWLDLRLDNFRWYYEETNTN